MSYTPSDFEYMSLAIRLAKQGIYTTHPNPRVGCVIVKNGKIISTGFHERPGQAHAEINALKNAKESVEGADVYVTLEPCSHTGKTPPCAKSLIEAKVGRVVAAMQDSNPSVAGKGLSMLEQVGIKTSVGLLENEARQLNPGFLKRMEHGVPFVRVKMASSMDGCTAMANGESQWITSPHALRDVQFLRAKSSAILTGTGTLRADDPSLNVRLSAEELGISGDVRQPVRVVLDAALSIQPEAKLLSLPGKVIIFTSQQVDLSGDHATFIKQCSNNDTQIELVPVPTLHNSTHLDLKQVLYTLANQFEINEVHVEAGAILGGQLMTQGLVDELVHYMAPSLMGSDARGLFNMPDLQHLKDRIELHIKDVRQVGKDLRIVSSVNTSA